MSKFGFALRRDNLIALDQANLTLRRYILSHYPEYNACISCGVCSAACTSAKLTNFNIREVKLNIDRGSLEALREDIERCILCGKCELACPRGISNRRITILINKFLQETNG